MEKKLETKRLTLRWLNFDDAKFILEILNEPSYLKNIGDRGVRNLEDAKQYLINKVFENYKKFGFGYFIVELKDSKIPVGMAGLMKRDWLPDVDIGFAFLEKHFGKGYATESAKAVMDYARKDLGLKRLTGITLPDNIESQKVLQKLGLKFEKMVKFPEYDKEDKLFSIDF